MSILASLFISLVIVPNYQKWQRDQNAPRMEMEVIEIEVMNGSWYREVYWREGYHVYNFSISNTGKSVALEVRLFASIPGGIFAVTTIRPYPGIEIYADPAAIEEGVFDPVELGKWMGWNPLGKQFKIIQGGSSFYVRFPYFTASSTFSLLVFFDENAIPGGPPAFDAKLFWVYDGESKGPLILTKVTRMQAPLKEFIIWSNNPYKYPENNDKIIPYAHADADPTMSGIQTTKEVFSNQTFDINIVFDYRNTTHPYASVAISIFPEWYEEPIKLYQDIQDHNYLEWNVTVNAPTELGEYSLRVIRSEFNYPTFYNCSDTGGMGFELKIYVIKQTEEG